MESWWTQEVTFPWPSASWSQTGALPQSSSRGLGFDLIQKPVMEEIRDIVRQSKVREGDESFAVFDMGLVVDRFRTWSRCFPDIEPHFAIKAHPDPAVISLLLHLGAGVDCASKTEMQLVLKAGGSPSDIIFSNTIKFPSHLKFAAEIGVSLMTFDNERELVKIKELAPRSRLLLRIAPQANFSIQYPLSKKFGCKIEEAEGLLKYAKDLGLNIVGVSFHVGSGVSDATVYIANIEAAKQVFDMAATLGINMNLLDIGGGFFGTEGADIKLEKMCEQINTTLRLLFPKSSGIKIISEPGRYFVEGSLTLAASVIGKRTRSEDVNIGNPKSDNNGVVGFEYYLSESAMGCLSLHTGYKGHDYKPIPVTNGSLNKEKFKSKLWGPTCDSVDSIQEVCYLQELDVGDWLVFRDVGAYSLCMASTFNGMQLCPVKRVMQEDLFKRMVAENGHNQKAVGSLYQRLPE